MEMMFCSLLRFIAPPITPAAPCLSYQRGELATLRMGPGLVAEVATVVEVATATHVISGVRDPGPPSH